MSTQLAPTPVLDDATEIAIFLHDLESLDECRCEADHKNNELIPACSAKVTHRYRDCRTNGKNVCKASAEYVYESISENFYVCDTCNAPCADCWSITPI